MKQTIFLTGHRKSGTTLLKSLLDGHPKISSYPTDLTLMYSYFPHVKFQKHTKKKLIQKICEIVSNSFKLVDDYVDLNKQNFSKFEIHLKKKLNSINLLSEKQVIQTVLKSWSFFFEKEKKNYLLLKETTQSMNFKILQKIFGNIKIIQIIRDPRDNFSSLKSGFDKYYKKIGYTEEDILLSAIFRMKNDLKFARILKNKRFFLCIKYEDLVKNTKKEIKKIFSFLKLDHKNFEVKPTILNKRFYGNNFKKKLYKISNENVNNWHSRISKKEEDFINFYLEDEIKYWKYPIEKNYNLLNVKKTYESINSKIFFKSKK